MPQKPFNLGTDPRGVFKGQGLSGPGGFEDVLRNRARRSEDFSKAMAKMVRGQETTKQDDEVLNELFGSMMGAGIIRTVGGGISRALGSRNVVLSKDVKPEKFLELKKPANRADQAMLVTRGGKHGGGKYVREKDFPVKQATREKTRQAIERRLTDDEQAIKNTTDYLNDFNRPGGTRDSLRIKLNRLIDELRDLNTLKHGDWRSEIKKKMREHDKTLDLIDVSGALEGHGVKFHIRKDGKLEVLSVYTKDGKPGESWEVIEPTLKAVQEYLGY